MPRCPLSPHGNHEGGRRRDGRRHVVDDRRRWRKRAAAAADNEHRDRDRQRRGRRSPVGAHFPFEAWRTGAHDRRLNASRCVGRRRSSGRRHNRPMQRRAAGRLSADEHQHAFQLSCEWRRELFADGRHAHLVAPARPCAPARPRARRSSFARLAGAEFNQMRITSAREVCRRRNRRRRYL